MLWYAEAGANGAFPLDDRGALELLTTPRPTLSPARNRYIYYPGVAEVPESQAVNRSVIPEFESNTASNQTR